MTYTETGTFIRSERYVIQLSTVDDPTTFVRMDKLLEQLNIHQDNIIKWRNWIDLGKSGHVALSVSFLNEEDMIMFKMGWT